MPCCVLIFNHVHVQVSFLFSLGWHWPLQKIYPPPPPGMLQIRLALYAHLLLTCICFLPLLSVQSPPPLDHIHRTPLPKMHSGPVTCTVHVHVHTYTLLATQGGEDKLALCTFSCRNSSHLLCYDMKWSNRLQHANNSHCPTAHGPPP